MTIHISRIPLQSGACRTAADRRIGQPLLVAARCFADGGYAGDRPRDSLRKVGKWTVEIIKRSDVAKGFVVLPRRWVVERTWHG